MTAACAASPASPSMVTAGWLSVSLAVLIFFRRIISSVTSVAGSCGRRKHRTSQEVLASEMSVRVTAALPNTRPRGQQPRACTRSGAHRQVPRVKTVMFTQRNVRDSSEKKRIVEGGKNGCEKKSSSGSTHTSGSALNHALQKLAAPFPRHGSVSSGALGC